MNDMSAELGVRQRFIFGHDYFTKWISYDQNKIPKLIDDLSTPSVNVKLDAQLAFRIFRKRYELLIKRYSRGDALNDLRAMLPEIVDTWEWALREELTVFTAEEMATRKGFAVNFDFYVICLWMMSIALCLEADDDLIARILAVIGNEGQDKLFETLVSQRVAGRKPANHWLYATVYDALIHVIADPTAMRTPILLSRFLDGWYPSMKKTYWHDAHLGKDGGGYFGYWCFEAAAVVKLFNLDDRSIRDHRYYPKDLAAFKLA